MVLNSITFSHSPGDGNGESFGQTTWPLGGPPMPMSVDAYIVTNGSGQCVATFTNKFEYWCCPQTITNRDSQCHLYAFWVNGNIAGGGTQISPPIPSGGTWRPGNCVTSTVPITQCEIQRYLCYGEPIADSTNSSNIGTNNPGYGTTQNGNNGNTSNTGTPNEQFDGSGSGTNNIQGNHTAGDSAIYDAITKFAAQNHGDLQNVTNAIGHGGGGSSFSTNYSFSTNSFTTNQVTFTNNFTLTNQVDFSPLTNYFNSFSNKNRWSDLVDTNALAGMANSASGSVAAAWGDVGGIGSLTANGGIPDTGGGTISVPAGMYSFDFNFANGLDVLSGDFANYFSDLWGLARRVALWIIYAVFLRAVLAAVWQSSQMILSGRGGWVPDLEFMGWNAAGYGLYVVLLVLVFGAYVAATIAFTYYLGHWTLLSDVKAVITGNPFEGVTGGVAHGVGWLAKAFPLKEAVSAFIGYLVFRAGLIPLSTGMVWFQRIFPI